MPPPEPADDDLQPLQSRQNNVQAVEEEETPVTSAAPSTTTGGLTTWRMDDDEFVNEPTDSPAVAESTFITTSDEPAAADTGLKVTDVDDVTTILPDDAAAAATDGVNDQPDGAVASDQEFDVVTDPSSVADTFRSDVTELSMTEQPEEPDSLLPKVNAAAVETFEGSAENDGSGDLPVVIRLEPSQPEEINMDPIVAQLTEAPEIEINNKAEMLDNLMKEEDLRPHQESKKDAAPTTTTTAESVTIENAELIHPTSQSPTEGIAGPSVTEEPVVFSTDSVQIEITKDQPAEKQELDASVSSQLKDDVESDITHILMEIPALPQSDSQIKEQEDESQSIQTEEPETVTILDFKSELGSAVDIHSEEIAESVTAVSDVLKLATEEPKVEVDSVSVQPDAIIIQEEEAETATKAELEFKVTDEGSGFDEILPVETHLLSSDEPTFKVDGSGDAPSTADAKEIEGSGSDPVETAVKIAELDPLEGSGSSSVQLVVDEPESRDQVIAVEEEEESPPEFRNDDILINRIRTIVNSLTNPRETSSILLRRTSDLFQSVFKRTKRSPSEEFDPSKLVRSPAFLRYLRSQPLPLRRALSPNFYGRFSRQMHPDTEFPTGEEEGDECDLHIKVSFNFQHQNATGYISFLIFQ